MLADRVIEMCEHWAHHAKDRHQRPIYLSDARKIRSSVVIRCDQVADYLNWREEAPDIVEIPTWAPPYETMFVESQLPRDIHMEVSYTYNNHATIHAFPARGTPRIGILAEYMPRPDPEHDPSVRWWLTISCFVEEQGWLHPPVFRMSAGIGPGGELVNPNDPRLDETRQLDPGAAIYAQAYFPWETKEAVAAVKAVKDSGPLDLPLFGFLGLAVSFMHCRNVEVVGLPPPSPRLQRARERRGKSLLVEARELVIRPIQEVREQWQWPGRATGQREEPRLHLCRGHFKDYRHGEGLFGRYKGLFFWNVQLRGNPKQGRTDQSVRIEPQR